MRLVRPYNKLAVPNVVEDKYNRAWAIIESEVERLLNLGWKMDTKGKGDAALKNYKAANYYIYLFHYTMNIDAYIEREGISRDCISEEVFCKFKIQCVQDNLPCISNELGANYLSVWKNLAKEFNIELNVVCEDDSLNTAKGEWEYCSFDPLQFTQTTGVGDVKCAVPDPSCSVIKQITP